MELTLKEQIEAVIAKHLTLRGEEVYAALSELADQYDPDFDEAEYDDEYDESDDDEDSL